MVALMSFKDEERLFSVVRPRFLNELQGASYSQDIKRHTTQPDRIHMTVLHNMILM